MPKTKIPPLHGGIIIYNLLKKEVLSRQRQRQVSRLQVGRWGSGLLLKTEEPLRRTPPQDTAIQTAGFGVKR